MNIASCILAMVLGGLIIALSEPLAMLLYSFYHKAFGVAITKDRLQRTRLVFLINGTIIMLVYAWSLHNALTATAPGN